MSCGIGAMKARERGAEHHRTKSLQVIDVVDAWGLGYRLGNALKYLSRHTEKNDPIGDLKKAIHCIELEIERRQTAPATPPQTPA